VRTRDLLISYMGKGKYRPSINLICLLTRTVPNFTWLYNRRADHPPRTLKLITINTERSPQWMHGEIHYFLFVNLRLDSTICRVNSPVDFHFLYVNDVICTKEVLLGVVQFFGGQKPPFLTPGSRPWNCYLLRTDDYVSCICIPSSSHYVVCKTRAIRNKSVFNTCNLIAYTYIVINLWAKNVTAIALHRNLIAAHNHLLRSFIPSSNSL
jgi:hypothetical protein